MILSITVFTLAVLGLGLPLAYGLLQSRCQADETYTLELMWPSRAEAVEELRELRSLWEREGCCEKREALALNDVCIVLGLSEAETCSVLGSAQFYIDSPIDVDA
jgi:hypothetical protein